VVEGPVVAALDAASGLRCAPALDLGVAAGVGRELWDEPCSTWVELPEQVPDGRYVALTVAGESMEPLLHGGDTILVKLGPALAKGAVIVARRPDDGYVVKRVGALTARSIELESLSPGYAPMRIPRRTDLVLGTVVLRWCEHSRRAASGV
jgi:phage repressor protein C with HTH and peptisase S24 domain